MAMERIFAGQAEAVRRLLLGKPDRAVRTRNQTTAIRRKVTPKAA
jgi:hypothetical protein